MNILPAGAEAPGLPDQGTLELAAAYVMQNAVQLFGVALLFLLSIELMSRALPRWQGRRGADFAARLETAAIGPCAATPWTVRRGTQRTPAALGGVAFEKRSLLKSGDYPLLPVLESAVRRHGQGHRVLTQVCLADLIRPRAASAAAAATAFRAISARKLGFAIVDRDGSLVAAVETEPPDRGTSAYLRDALARDIVERAGAAWKTFPADAPATAVEDWVDRLLRPRLSAKPAGSPPPRAPRPESRASA